MQKKRLRGTSPPGRLAKTNGVSWFCRTSLTHPALGFPPSDASVLRIFLRLLFFPAVALLSQQLAYNKTATLKKNVCFCATQRGASQSLLSFLWICTTHYRTHTHFTFWMFHSRLSEEQPMTYSTLLKLNVIERQHVYVKCIWKVFTAFSYVTALLHNGWMLKIKNPEITCTYCKYSQPSVVLKPPLWLAVRLGLLSCWKTNRRPTLRSWSSDRVTA